MKWSYDEPVVGDMVRVKLGSIYHYGIYVAENEVIQFGLAPNIRHDVLDKDICVCSSDVETFLSGGFLEKAILDKKELKKCNSPEKVVEIAKSRLGEKGYNIIHNNCEHFANECVFGKRISIQTETVRALFKNLGAVNVYIMKVPNDVEIKALYPNERNEEILNCNNEQVKKQKYVAWKLLEYALNDLYSFDIKNLHFNKTIDGKWTCKECYFSISNANDVVVVACARTDIGVDIEELRDIEETFAKRSLTEKEYLQFKEVKNKDRFTIEKWTQKESIYKSGKVNSFIPNEIECDKYPLYSTSLNIDDKEYYLSVCNINTKQVKIIKNITIDI